MTNQGNSGSSGNSECQSILQGAEDPREDPMFDNKIGYIPFAYHLLPKEGLAKVAAVMRAGERAGRGPTDWREIPIEEQLNHAMSHIVAYLAGKRGDHHLANAATRVLMALDMDNKEPLPKPKFKPTPPKKPEVGMYIAPIEPANYRIE